MIVFYACGVSVIAFLFFGMDKQRAQSNDWRIPEATLLFFALIGGGFGAKMGQNIFRHKTRKEPFRSTLNMLIIWNAAAYGYVIFKLI